MAQGRRVERLAALIRREMSELLIHGIRDQRIHDGMVTITDVEVSGDLQHCKIFVSIYGESHQKDLVLEDLQSASGFLRGELGRNLQLRRAPEINFKIDKGIEKGMSVLNLLGKLEEERKDIQKTGSSSLSDEDKN